MQPPTPKHPHLQLKLKFKPVGTDRCVSPAPRSWAPAGQVLGVGTGKGGQDSDALAPRKATGAKGTDPRPASQPPSSAACQGRSQHAFPAVWGHAASWARGPWKASSSAHYRNLIWIPRDQEALVESGCHKGRDAEANPSQLIPGTPGLFSWSSGRGLPESQMSQLCTAGQRQQAGHTAGRRGRVLAPPWELDQPQAFGLKG